MPALLNLMKALIHSFLGSTEGMAPGSRVKLPPTTYAGPFRDLFPGLQEIRRAALLEYEKTKGCMTLREVSAVDHVLNIRADISQLQPGKVFLINFSGELRVYVRICIKFATDCAQTLLPLIKRQIIAVPQHLILLVTKTRGLALPESSQMHVRVARSRQLPFLRLQWTNLYVDTDKTLRIFTMYHKETKGESFAYWFTLAHPSITKQIRVNPENTQKLISN